MTAENSESLLHRSKEAAALIPPLPLFCCRLTVVEPSRNTPLELSHNPVFAVLQSLINLMAPMIKASRLLNPGWRQPSEQLRTRSAVLRRRNCGAVLRDDLCLREAIVDQQPRLALVQLRRPTITGGVLALLPGRAGTTSVCPSHLSRKSL